MRGRAGLAPVQTLVGLGGGGGYPFLVVTLLLFWVRGVVLGAWRFPFGGGLGVVVTFSLGSVKGGARGWGLSGGLGSGVGNKVGGVVGVLVLVAGWGLLVVWVG